MIKKQTVYKSSPDGYIKAIDGIYRKTLVWGNNALLTEFKLAGGKKLPLHKHDEEQVGYLVNGHIILLIGNIKYDMLPGDSWAIPGGVEHSAEIIEDSLAIEVFSPVRSDYLPE
ncbi:putative pectin degradation protein [hydrocarbon metagenome]|uniref:Putative pectin degradation protein n=1 Tax=hydrocarbon metagenome TaxID=938273 RepID=A0A0W8E5T6_9ZZZZ